MKYEQNKVELTSEAMMGLKSEAAIRRKSLKETASELIMAGLSRPVRDFVRSVLDDNVQIIPRAAVVEPEVDPEPQAEAEEVIVPEPDSEGTVVRAYIDDTPGASDRIRQLRAEGRTMKQIADEVGFSKSAVGKFCKRNGL